ncbi:type IV toxin-antitoxin system AbiEi family antitoxin domain-containing protein [Microbacterium sp. 1.5R]|uniref:type IV toxin-antitoxin system AbiEi family antitoxin domain-containing protein n=1 Tax=Microbacterium sp. 1.5R TaxID=1916917 RepID=UPI0011A6F276|nr:type IV toxin-antitoxin system AbiEi family antitoxin domain-containing protein [Microbacterium sp. 1.5R]
MLLRSRAELIASGSHTEREIRDRERAGDLRRVHRGFYIENSDWSDLWAEGRHLVRALAVRRASPGPGPIFSHLSAAAVWGLPLFGAVAPEVHTIIEGRRHTRTESGVVRHDLTVDREDIVESGGIRLTSPVRTVFDLARTTSRATALAAADAALRSEALRGRFIDAAADGDWRERLSALCTPGLRGVRHARWIGEFADGRAQLPGESVSRLHLHTLGFRDVQLQVPVTGADGDQYYLDFGLPRARTFGEFDGEAKYLEPSMRRASSPAEVVLAEKRREDDIRGVTGWRLVRWGGDDLRSPDALAARLAAFGIRPS